MVFGEMRIYRNFRIKLGKIAVNYLVATSIFSVGTMSVGAHGGEDHGDAKPQTVASDRGVSRSSRLGELEVTIKHPVLDPDTAANGSLFITKYKTNDAVDKAEPTLEIENAAGQVTQVIVTRSDLSGTFALKIPPLPEGTYTMRVKVTYSGEADTLTFSGVNISHAEAAAEISSGISWLRTVLLMLTGTFVLVLFAGLFYLVWRSADSGEGRREPVSI